MEKLKVRKYQKADFPRIKKYMEQLYDFTSSLDDLGRMKRQSGYGGVFTNDLLIKVKETGGVIYVATNVENVVGFVACTLIRPSEKGNLASIRPIKDGRVDKLFVEEDYRDQGVGTELMKTAEDFFKKSGCDLARVEVFIPNTNAHRLYGKLSYEDRVVDMVKRL